MKNFKFLGFIAAVVLFLGIGIFVIVRQESKGSGGARAAKMAANRLKPALNTDMPGLDAPRVPTASAKAEPAPVAAPSAAKLREETDFAALLAPDAPQSAQGVVDDLANPKAAAVQVKKPLPATQALPPSNAVPVASAPVIVKQQPSVQPAPSVDASVEGANSPADYESLKASVRRLEQQVIQITAKADAAAASAREEVTALKNARSGEATQARDLAARANNNVDVIRSLIDTLILKTGTLEMAQADLRKTAGKVAFLNQGNQILVGHTREYATVTEKGEIMANLPGLPATIQVSQQALDFGVIHQAIANSNSIDGFTKALSQLAGAGYDVHLVVGEPNPKTRPVWLEIYDEKGLSVLHPELNGSAFQHLDSRKGLPNVFSTGAFGVTYSQGKADAYRLTR